MFIGNMRLPIMNDPGGLSFFINNVSDYKCLKTTFLNSIDLHASIGCFFQFEYEVLKIVIETAGCTERPLEL